MAEQNDNTEDKDQHDLPDLHTQTFKYKNRKRLQRDGGRAWIQDSQLHEARKDGNLYLERDPEYKDEED